MVSKSTESQLQNADAFMKLALIFLRNDGDPKDITEGSRERSIAITKLEEAMMWNNKDRTIRGFLKPYETHEAK